MTGDKKAAARAEGEAAVQKSIADMPDVDRKMGGRLHAIITESAPELIPRTWYGMPAYTDGSKIVCFFRTRQKFGERYMTFGFNDVAKLDDGNIWPTYFALIGLNESDEKHIAGLVRKAVGK